MLILSKLTKIVNTKIEITRNYVISSGTCRIKEKNKKVTPKNDFFHYN
jgi:hypothetical protein